MRFLQVTGCLLLLLPASCATSPKVAGYTSTPADLRTRILWLISQSERTERNCAAVSSVTADDPALPQFMKAPNARVFNTGPSNEIWTVMACGTERRYAVVLQSDHGAVQLQSVELVK